ncbi:putative site-specific integrase-resolvase [Oribacterium sinus]|uniref:Putative site-specific integrase-resolvase n=1 Tax=Oribacterium sinus TaxID=237576 RepID=A0A7W9W2A7_9FIRM|nr:DNA-binding protein [Oribacterium sinus]MBB6040714.1 putative site-specific integrase-resolvase [Oribacterium sinus]
MDKLYSRKEAAQVLGISLSKLDRAKAAGLISYIQYVENGSILFSDAALREFVVRNTKKHCH